MSELQLQFLGGTDTVTGSKFLLEYGDQRVLVDCGMFQGLEPVEKLNWAEPPIDPATIDAVVLTHGHLDHTGALPRYHKLGFRGPVYGTAPTLDVAEIILRDSARIQEWQAEEDRKHADGAPPVDPLYESEDAQAVINRFAHRPVNTRHRVTDDISYRARRAGHILGATFLEVEAAGRQITFSGDLGRSTNPIVPGPEAPRDTEVLVLESTYGNRCHVEYKLLEMFEEYIRTTIDQGGSVLIPSFAVERSQHVMWLLHTLARRDRIPDVPMYLDTPMGIDVCGLYGDYPEWHQLTIREWREAFDQFIPVEAGDRSQSIVEAREPKIVIAGSGMVSGGRILSYLEQHLTDPDSLLLLVGYQAEGTRGRALQEGSDTVEFHGTPVPVRIRVETLAGLSAHAGQRELLAWCSRMDNPPERTYLVHGEQQARSVLQTALEERHDMACTLTERNDTVSLDASG